MNIYCIKSPNMEGEKYITVYHDDSLFKQKIGISIMLRTKISDKTYYDHLGGHLCTMNNAIEQDDNTYFVDNFDLDTISACLTNCVKNIKINY